jgi:hypothetical protein
MIDDPQPILGGLNDVPEHARESGRAGEADGFDPAP